MIIGGTWFKRNWMIFFLLLLLSLIYATHATEWYVRVEIENHSLHIKADSFEVFFCYERNDSRWDRREAQLWVLNIFFQRRQTCSCFIVQDWRVSGLRNLKFQFSTLSQFSVDVSSQILSLGTTRDLISRINKSQSAFSIRKNFVCLCRMNVGISRYYSECVKRH